MSESHANLTTKNRPDRNDYPLTPAGDLGFAQALVVWQGDELDRLQAEVAELRRDAERLDWMERIKPITFCPAFESDWWFVYPRHHDENSFRGKTLREAIDAALGEQP